MVDEVIDVKVALIDTKVQTFSNDLWLQIETISNKSINFNILAEYVYFYDCIFWSRYWLSIQQDS